MTYKMSFIITTDADSTTLLELIERQSFEFVDSLAMEYDEDSTLDETSQTVEEVQS